MDPRRRILATTGPPPENQHHRGGEEDFLVLQLVGWIVQSTASAISGCISVAQDALRRAEEAEKTFQALPSGAVLALRRLVFGAVGAAYAGLLLVVLLVAAVLVGVVAVRMWVEEPVFLREPLYFDYTEDRPSATLFLGGIHGTRDIPVGHTFFASLSLVLPESDFNRHLGVFQVSAKVTSATGIIKATSSHPCMLQFRSFPVRLTQTFFMSLPLVMGILDETQEIRVVLLKQKEMYPKTVAIKVMLSPRAGTTALPELYAAEIIINSQLPWEKELVRNWKWTCYVWSSLYVYIMLVMILVCCCKPIIFPMVSISNHSQREQTTQVAKDQQSSPGGDGAVSDEYSDMLRKWRESRSTRKSLMTQTLAMPDPVSSCASSIARDRTGNGVGETGESATSESEYESC